MQLVYLIKSAEVKNRFLGERLPDGVVLGAVGTYEADGGNLYIISFRVDGFTISGARTLARLRHKLCHDANARLLTDDPSQKFAIALYPRFAEYERKLRRAIVLAMCAERDNYDNGLANGLERLSLEGLGRQLFYDTAFQNKIKSKTKESFTKEEIVSFASKLEESTVWAQLFGEGALSNVSKNYFELCGMRNKVMHQRLITEKDYDRTRKMLKESTSALDIYAEKVRSDVSYPKRHAGCAADAAKILRENYTSMFRNLDDGLGQLSTAVNAAQDLTSGVDLSSFAQFAEKMAGVQEVIDRNREMCELASRAMSNGLVASQSSIFNSGLGVIAQQIESRKRINEGIAASLSQSSAFANWSTSQVNSLSHADACASHSVSNIGLFGNEECGMNGAPIEGPLEEGAEGEAGL